MIKKVQKPHVYDEDKIIVSRHPGIVRWFREIKGVNARAVANIRSREIEGKTVYTSGLSLSFVAKANGVFLCRIPAVFDTDFDYLTAQEIDAMNPTLTYLPPCVDYVDDDEDISAPRHYEVIRTA